MAALHRSRHPVSDIDGHLYELTWVRRPVAPASDPAFHRRLALITGNPPAEAFRQLKDLAEEARDSPGFALMSALCRTLSDDSRLLIASMLKRQEPLSGTELQAALGLSQPTISHHMGILTESGIIHAERTGKWVYYKLDPRFARLVP